MPDIGRDDIVAKKRQPLWWQKQGLQYTASGYGAKIPTEWVIKVKGSKKWHRVYVAQYGNAGSGYIVKGGKKVFLYDTALS